MVNWLWIGIGLGVTYTSPIWGSQYIGLLGKTVNREVQGESGFIWRIRGTPERITGDHTVFEHTMQLAGCSPWIMMIPGMPILFTPVPIISTFAYISHVYQFGFERHRE